MLPASTRPKEAHPIIVTLGQSQSRIPAKSSDESVYSLVYPDEKPERYSSRHASRVKSEAKNKSMDSLNKSFKRLATDSTPPLVVPKNVPATGTGLYVTRGGVRTGTVPRTQPKKATSAEATLGTKSRSAGSGIFAKAKVPSRYVSPRTKPSSSKAPAPPRRKSGETQNILIVETPLEIHAEPAVEIPAAAESEIAECIQEAGIPSSGSTARLLSNAERIDILADLKVQWERLSDAYRRLPIASDTPSRMRRKGDLEAQLQVLEKEMERFASSNVMVA